LRLQDPINPLGFNFALLAFFAVNFYHEETKDAKRVFRDSMLKMGLYKLFNPLALVLTVIWLTINLSDRSGINNQNFTGESALAPFLARERGVCFGVKMDGASE
jgi:hypothetical protein